jgi:FkbM family methyltransferase
MKISTRTSRQPFKELLLRRVASSYIRRNNRKYAEARGHRMAVYANDLVGLDIFLDGEYEKDEIQDIFDLLTVLNIDLTKSVAVDIGANIGNHSISFAKKFSKVISFEPNPHTFKLLSFNTGFFPNIIIYNTGMSDRQGVISMSEDVTNYGGSSAVYNYGDNTSVEVQVQALDDHIAALDDVRLIKIDVEGMEDSVLRGAEKVIIKYQPIIVFEQHPSDFNDEETRSIKFLRSKGYDFLWAIKSSRSSYKFLRILKSFYEVFFGRTVTRSLVGGPLVPRGRYPMLIALPKSYLSQSRRVGA